MFKYLQSNQLQGKFQYQDGPDATRSSTFRTITGDAITLTPIPPDARYVLEYDPSVQQHYWT